jgi:iron complex outermembrane receptor protein
MENGLSPFISFSQSFEPQTGTTWQGTPFVPVTGRQFEAGLKWNPKGTKAVLTLSAYDLRRQKVPVTDPQAGTAGIPSSSQIQIGEVRVRGIEFEGRGDLGAGFDIIAAASLTDAIITQGAPAIAATSSTAAPPARQAPANWARLNGPHLPLLRMILTRVAHMGLAGPARWWRPALCRRFRWHHNLCCDQWRHYFPTLFHKTSRWWMRWFPMTGRAKTELSGWTLAINVANLFDKTHISACPFNNSCYYGAPRTVTVTLRYSW